MKTLSLCFMVLFTLHIEGAAASDNSLKNLQAALQNCSKIVTQDSRLECYDNLANSFDKPKPVDNSANLTKAKKAAEVPTAAARKEPQPVNLAEKNTKKLEQEFGKKPVVVTSSISSRLKGEFKKWQKGQKLYLENGQVWVVKRANTGYKKMKNPLITITEDLLGGFTAKVDGLNSTAKVRRIK